MLASFELISKSKYRKSDALQATVARIWPSITKIATIWCFVAKLYEAVKQFEDHCMKKK